jgi:hypothetical protein
MYEDNAAADMYPHIHIYVTQGDSDNVRGTVLADYYGATEEGTSAVGMADTPTGQNPVNGSVGDRIVVEIGYQARNTSAAQYIGYVYRGGTGATDLTNGAAAPTYPGWLDFTLEAAAASCPLNLLRTQSVPAFL